MVVPLRPRLQIGLKWLRVDDEVRGNAHLSSDFIAGFVEIEGPCHPAGSFEHDVGDQALAHARSPAPAKQRVIDYG